MFFESGDDEVGLFGGSNNMKKDHICRHPGCNRSFTRAEHLRRHALNHEQPRSGFTCERCSVHFKRSDLLGEHKNIPNQTCF